MAGIIPQPRSYQHLVGDMVDAFLSEYGLRGLKIGGPILSFIESAAQGDLRGAQDIFNLLDSIDIDRATGIALDRKALDDDTARLPILPSSGPVTITDTSFIKISTKIYPGAPAPNGGSLSIKVADASNFPATGQIYVGRGTTNYEGPISYNSRSQPVGATYWTINLSTPTQKFHDVNEGVVLANGGNRQIPAGTVIRTPQGNVADAVTFATVAVASIPDGETDVTGVSVICQQPGTIGNVPKSAVSEFQSDPFVGATVTNPAPFDNGQPSEDDTALRERIKAKRKSRSLGTALALITNAKGLQAPDENKSVISASVISPQGGAATLYIDDGTGYEEVSQGISVESIIDRALGGEYQLKLRGGAPIAKASATTTLTSPFELVSGSKLSIKVAGVLTEHTFNTSEFRYINNATAYEVVAAINGDPNLLFSARTSDSGSKVVVFARSEINEDLEIVEPDDGINANTYLGFPSGTNYTLRLYKNDQLLYKDGKKALVLTAPQAVWKQTLGSGVYAKVRVDRTKAVTYKIVDQDFVDAGTGYVTVSPFNSLESWAAVLNNKIPGITTSVSSGRLQFESNRGSNAAAAIVVSEPVIGDIDENGNILTGALGFDPTFNLVKQGVFSADIGLAAFGRTNDYTLNRNTGELKLTQPLSLGQTLSAGTTQARAYIQSDEFPSSDVTLAQGATTWICVDDPNAITVNTSINAGVSFTVTNQGNGRIRYAASPTGAYFQNVRYGDWCIIYDPAFQVHGSWRVSFVDSSYNYFEIERHAVGLQTGVTMVASGMIFVRSTANLQVAYVSAGTNRTLTSVAQEIAGQLIGASASVYRNKQLRLSTNNLGSSGAVFVAAVDTSGVNLKLPRGRVATNTEAHLAYVESGNTSVGTPSFALSKISAINGDAFTIQTLTGSASSMSAGDMISWVRRQGSDAFGKLAGVTLPILHTTGGNVVSPRATLNSYTIPTASLSRSGSVVTATIGSHSFSVGDIAYIRPTSVLDVNFPAGVKVVAAISATTIQYNESGSGGVSTQPYVGFEDLGAMVEDRVWSGHPYAIGYDDNLTVVVDGEKNYNLTLARKIKPAPGATYTGTALAVIDANNSNQPLSTAFGSNDPNFFRDFYVFMKSRVKSHSTSGGSAPTNYHYNKAILWRYVRPGPEGNAARVSYVNPSAPNQGLAVTTLNGGFADILVRLPSDSARTGLNIFDTTKFVVSYSSSATTLVTFTHSKPTATLQRTSNVVTATTGSVHGFVSGDVIYLTSASPMNFPSGPKIVASAPSATTLTYVEDGLNVAPTAGSTIASAPVDPNFASVQIGDIASVGTSVNVGSADRGAFRVVSKTSNSVSFRRVNGGVATGSVPISVGSSTGIQFFPIKASESTATKIAQFVNSNATGIVSAVVVENGGGAPGTGIIDVSTFDEFALGYNNSSLGSVSAWAMLDGVNYVESSDLAVTPNTFSFKSQVSSDLIANSDFSNEEMFLVPVTSDAIIRFLSSPAISGLYAGATLTPSNAGGLLINSNTMGASGSIQVTGGTANAAAASIVGVGSIVDTDFARATVLDSQTKGLIGGAYVAVQCVNTQQKQVAITSATTLNVVAGSTSGQWVLTFNNPVRTLRQAITDANDYWHVSKQGRFACYTIVDNVTTNTIAPSVTEGDWTVIAFSGANPANVGTFRVIRKSADGLSFWVENPNVIEEYIDTLSGDSISFYSYDSVMSGDVFSVDTDTLGALNRGTFTVVNVSTNAVTVAGNMQALSTTVLGSSSEFVRFIEAEPLRLIKKIRTISPANGLSGYSDVIFTTSALAPRMTSTAGAEMQALDKFAFPIDFVMGRDAYAYSTGLIGEVSRVMYGDPTNPSVYPGVVAAGAMVNISGPLVKRIQVGLAARINKGDPKSVIDRIKSAVASRINKVGLGKAVAISSIISAAEAIDGVESVVILSPNYGPGTDLIPVQANEKPRVLDVDQDILVSIVG
jgi:hypothetical protein